MFWQNSSKSFTIIFVENELNNFVCNSINCLDSFDSLGNVKEKDESSGDSISLSVTTLIP